MMDATDSDDSEESLVRAFEDVIRLASDMGYEDERLRFYASNQSCHGQNEKGDSHVEIQEHENTHESDWSFETRDSSNVQVYDFTTSGVQGASFMDTLSYTRSQKYAQSWNDPSNAEDTVSRRTGQASNSGGQRDNVLQGPVPHTQAEVMYQRVQPHDSLNQRRNVDLDTASEEQEQDQDQVRMVPTDMQMLRSETENRMDEWTEGMVHTEATRGIVDLIAQGKTWITVTGGPGEGKTTAAFMALKSLHNKGKQVYDITCPEDYFKAKKSRRHVLMFNDIFGTSHFESYNLVRWTSVLNDILSMKEHRGEREIAIAGSVREGNHTLRRRKVQPVVILVSRSCVLVSASHHLGRFKDFILEADNVVDLTGNKKSVPEERIKIWNYHAQTFKIEINSKLVKEVCCMSLPYGFPHCCKLFASMYSKNRNLNMKTFFSRPLTFLNQTMESYMMDTLKGKLLREMLRYDGFLQLGTISDHEVRYHFGMVVNQLKGVVLTQTGDIVKFEHPSVHDSAAFVLCMSDPTFVVNNCSLSFLNERVRCRPAGTGACNTELTVTIGEPYTHLLMERLGKELESNNISLALAHDTFHDEQFLSKFMDFILPIQQSQARSECIRELIHKRDKESGLSLLFLSSISRSDCILRYICNFVELSDEEQTDALFGICEHRAVKSLHFFLSRYEYMNLNVTNVASRTPLMVCATKSSEEMMKLLLSRNVDVTAVDEEGNSVLHHICDVGVDGDGDVVRMLIDHGASADVESQIYPFIPLHTTCARGHINVLTALLDRGVDINKTDIWGDTSLHVSCTEGHTNIVSALLQNGAKLNIQNIWGDTPIYLASSTGNYKVVEVLLDKGANPNLKNVSGDTPLCAAIAEGHSKVVNMLLDGKAAINMKGSEGDTPLYTACIGGHAVIVEALLDRGADVNMTSDSGDTPLCAACARRHVKVVMSLLEHGANTEETGRCGDTPLCAACIGGHARIVTALLESGAHINRTDMMGSSPLHIAHALGHIDVVKVLLHKGGEWNFTDKQAYPS